MTIKVRATRNASDDAVAVSPHVYSGKIVWHRLLPHGSSPNRLDDLA